ncbi:hypothetical protein YC2023_007628 [Brassica napus]
MFGLPLTAYALFHRQHLVMRDFVRQPLQAGIVTGGVLGSSEFDSSLVWSIYRILENNELDEVMRRRWGREINLGATFEGQNCKIVITCVKAKRKRFSGSLVLSVELQVAETTMMVKGRGRISWTWNKSKARPIWRIGISFVFFFFVIYEFIITFETDRTTQSRQGSQSFRRLSRRVHRSNIPETTRNTRLNKDQIN